MSNNTFHHLFNATSSSSLLPSSVQQQQAPPSQPCGTSPSPAASPTAAHHDVHQNVPSESPNPTPRCGSPAGSFAGSQRSGAFQNFNTLPLGGGGGGSSNASPVHPGSPHQFSHSPIHHHHHSLAGGIGGNIRRNSETIDSGAHSPAHHFSPNHSVTSTLDPGAAFLGGSGSGFSMSGGGGGQLHSHGPLWNLGSSLTLDGSSLSTYPQSAGGVSGGLSTSSFVGGGMSRTTTTTTHNNNNNGPSMSVHLDPTTNQQFSHTGATAAVVLTHQPPRILQQQRRMPASSSSTTTGTSSSTAAPLLQHYHHQTRANQVFPISQQQQLNTYSSLLSIAQQQHQHQPPPSHFQQSGGNLAMQSQQQQQHRLQGAGSPLLSGGAGAGGPKRASSSSDQQQQQQQLTPHQLLHLQQQQAAAASQGRLIVVDPMRPKLRVPLTAITATRALTRSGANPSLCMLFLQGKCRQEGNCHQVHADPTIIQALREEAALQPTCCQEHGDSNDGLRPTEWPRHLVFHIQQVAVPLSSVAYTAGLKRFVEEAVSQHQYHQQLLQASTNSDPSTTKPTAVTAADVIGGYESHNCNSNNSQTTTAEMLSTATTASNAMITVGGKPLPAAASTSTMGETPGTLTTVASRLSVVSDVPLSVMIGGAAFTGGGGVLVGTPPKLVVGTDSVDDGNSPSNNSCGSATQQTSPQTLTGASVGGGGGGVDKWAFALPAGPHHDGSSQDSSMAPQMGGSAVSPPMSGHGDDLEDEAKFLASLTALEAQKHLQSGVKPPAAAVSTGAGIHTIEHSLAITSVCQLHFGAGDDQLSNNVATGGRPKQQPTGCRYGEDCKFLHVCRHIIRSELGAIMPQVVPTSSASPHLSSHHSGSSSPINAANRSHHATAAPSPSFGAPGGGAGSSSASPIPRAPSGISAHTGVSSLNASPVHFPTSAYHSPQTSFQVPGMIMQHVGVLISAQQAYGGGGSGQVQFLYDAQQMSLQSSSSLPPQHLFPQQQQQQQTMYVAQTDSDGNVTYVPCIIVNNNNNQQQQQQIGGSQQNMMIGGTQRALRGTNHNRIVSAAAVRFAHTCRTAPTAAAATAVECLVPSNTVRLTVSAWYASALVVLWSSAHAAAAPAAVASTTATSAAVFHPSAATTTTATTTTRKLWPTATISIAGVERRQLQRLVTATDEPYRENPIGSLNSEIPLLSSSLPYSPALSSHGAPSPQTLGNQNRNNNAAGLQQQQQHQAHYFSQAYQQQQGSASQQLTSAPPPPQHQQQQQQPPSAVPPGGNVITAANIQFQQQLQLMNGGSFAMASNNGSMAFSTASSFALPPPADARSATSVGISNNNDANSNNNAAAAAAAYFMMQQNTSLVGLSGSMVRPLSHTSSACASPPTASPRGRAMSFLPPMVPAPTAASSGAVATSSGTTGAHQQQLSTSNSNPSLGEDEL
ncbi:Hypothetical protein, putative, partial [Bodo saltans]